MVGKLHTRAKLALKLIICLKDVTAKNQTQSRIYAMLCYVVLRMKKINANNYIIFPNDLSIF